MNKKVAFCTLGCKVNQYETNAMIQKFLDKNYKVVEFEEVADIYVINTCTVTNMADKKSRQMIRRVKQLNPESVLVAVGCYAQVGKEELEKIEEIDLILGTSEKNNIVEYVENYISYGDNKKEISDVMKQVEFLDFGEITYTDKTRAVIKVEDGCDRFCSYCIIPYARGRVRSRLPKSIIKEIEENAKKGIKEVIITGIHIGSYGKDFKEKYRLIDLLEEINLIEGIKRIRLGSLEPITIDEEFVERLKKLDKICHHFHLSLQSGCDNTLERMNRKYNTNQFRESCKLLRKVYDDVILTADVIVGFPGETEEDFNETYKFLKEIAFYKIHIFKYSQRKGTKAAVMPNQIPPQIKEERSKKLIELSNKKQQEYNEKYIGKNVEVLFEEINGNYIKGHTQNYIVVNVEEKKEKIQHIIKNVKIQKAANGELFGVLI